jgi:hypothetical protein
VHKEKNVWGQIATILLEAMITAVLMCLLFKHQTNQSFARERDMKVFEKKQEVYLRFMEQLRALLKDGVICVGELQYADGVTQSNRVSTARYEKCDELKDIVFELSFMGMLESDEVFGKIMAQMTKTAETVRDFDNARQMYGIADMRTAHDFYYDLASSTFAIMKLLQADLYGRQSVVRNEEMLQFEKFLTACGLPNPAAVKDATKTGVDFWRCLEGKLGGERSFSVERLADQGQTNALARPLASRKFATSIETVVRSFYRGSFNRTNAYKVSLKLGEIVPSNEAQPVEVSLVFLVLNGWLLGYQTDAAATDSAARDAMRLLCEEVEASGGHDFGYFDRGRSLMKKPPDDLNVHFLDFESVGKIKDPKACSDFADRICGEIFEYIEIFERMKRRRGN